ncbi:unnamed protein product [Mytilus edulis]|uniref:Integrase catalytic domain-containing protein n=1 Tax=Mytilus edulis TaxID=6550 RepID=A0A8S3R3B2_MYTED|nr:unnamed protein product [Mytilus edulis]
MHPRSDGMVERGNRTINEMLSKYIDRNQSDWDKYIDYMVMAYNSTPHDSTGITPYRMMFGDEKKMPLDLIAGSPRWQPQVVKGGKKNLYRNCPWVIIEKLTDVLFKIRHSKNSPNVVVHADNLKKYKGVKSVSWFKPEKTILHAQPPLINYFDSEHELRSNGASENTHDNEPTLMQSDEYQTDETLEPPENCVDKTLEPSDSSFNKALEPPDNSLNKTFRPPDNSVNKTLEPPNGSLNKTSEPPDGTRNRSKSVTSPIRKTETVTI